MKKYLLVIFVGVALGLPASALAARLFLETPSGLKGVGQKFEVKIFADTAGESINAWSGTVRFAADKLELLTLHEGNSVINFWVEEPHFEEGTIGFSGITPGGFAGARGLLFTAAFRGLRSGDALIAMENAELLKNDGGGTALEPALGILNLHISTDAETAAVIESDSEPPESFPPAVSRSAHLFQNRYFLAFATQDKSSGVDGYFVAESRRRLGHRDWVAAASPYVLKDQDLRSYIFVKAVDRAGNEHIEIFLPQNRSPAVQALFWIIIILAAILLLGGLTQSKWKR